jgi:hypothetical protein
MVLTMVLIVVVLLLAITGATLSLSRLELKKTSNYKLGTQALEVADASVPHALSAIPPGINFPYNTETLVVPSTASSSLPGFSYSVTALNTAGGTQAVLTSTALGPNGTKKVIVVYAARGNYGLGSVHAPGDAENIETEFSGTSFTIDGSDRCNAAPAVPGITTTDPALVTEITNDTLDDGGLDDNQMDSVTGAGGTPSVIFLSDPSMTVSQIADAYLALSHDDLAGGNYSSNESWGTATTPRITRVSGDAQIQGTIEGYGVLIVDGSLDIAGNFTFHGLVIARGDIGVQVNGNAGLYGSLLIQDSTTQDPTDELDIRGNAVIHYDSCALAAAEGWVPLPKAARILAWKEKM